MTRDTTTRPVGFYADLERLILEQLKQHPGQAELRLKLLEVYCETGRTLDFQREAHALRPSLEGPDGEAAFARVAGMGRMLGISDPLFAAAAPAPEAGPASAMRARPVLQRRIGEDGRYRQAFAALAADHAALPADPRLQDELDRDLVRLAERPTPLHDAERLTRACGGARILLKRDDLAPPGYRLLVAVAGQGALARRLGRKTLVTSTGSGARGLLTASIGARLGLQVVVFMDRDDLTRQKLAAFRMRLLGAELKPVTRRDLPMRDVRYAALDHWAQQAAQSFPVMGLDGAPPPYDLLTREIPNGIGRETRRQVQALTGRGPDVLVARGRETPDAIGWFEPFLGEATRLVCVEAARDLGIKRKDELFGTAAGTSPEALRRMAQTEIANLELAPVAREHGQLRAAGRLEYVKGAPDAARKALIDLSALEGVVPSIETAHALGWACQQAARMTPEQTVVVMLAEAADADLSEINRALENQL